MLVGERPGGGAGAPGVDLLTRQGLLADEADPAARAEVDQRERWGDASKSRSDVAGLLVFQPVAAS